MIAGKQASESKPVYLEMQSAATKFIGSRTLFRLSISHRVTNTRFSRAVSHLQFLVLAVLDESRVLLRGCQDSHHFALPVHVHRPWASWRAERFGSCLLTRVAEQTGRGCRLESDLAGSNSHRWVDEVAEPIGLRALHGYHHPANPMDAVVAYVPPVFFGLTRFRSCLVIRFRRRLEAR